MTSRKVLPLLRTSETAWAAWFLHRQTLQGNKSEASLVGVSQYELLDQVPEGVRTGLPSPDDKLTSTPPVADVHEDATTVDRGTVFHPPMGPQGKGYTTVAAFLGTETLTQEGYPPNGTLFKKVPVAGHFLVFGFRYTDGKTCAGDEPQLWLKVSKSSAVCVGLILNADQTAPYLMEGAPLIIGHKATFKDRTTVIALCSVTKLFLGPQLGTFTKTIGAEVDMTEPAAAVEEEQTNVAVEQKAKTKKSKAAPKSKKSAKKNK
jgi:hypothetical protein